MPWDGFAWDESKRATNLEKHGIDFRDAIGIFDGPHLTSKTIRNDEVRMVSLGRIAESVIAVVWTDRAGVVRIISARAARRNERQIFAARFGA
ncbi:BrnT family toxin [Methylobacterium sp. J-088]|uniref:BrnT family toxin n=1 Tax=Methylobacterium sp. J-088 TaxID=2836664 RepID=UPI001FB86BF3|nr:BrnT family toxin [Methylobacterium sp. J-088]MCJ2065413.1 BrnT family toxin [Methylobacterium sp. J-088]